MDPHEFLAQVSIPTPCPMEWADMKGDDRVRYCATCSKHVYDISAMPAVDAANFIQSHKGELCVQFYRRPDGTIVTAKCSSGFDRPRLIRSIGGAALAVVAVLGITAPNWVVWLVEFQNASQNYGGASPGDVRLGGCVAVRGAGVPTTGATTAPTVNGGN
jgi:hypothetical protein